MTRWRAAGAAAVLVLVLAVVGVIVMVTSSGPAGPAPGGTAGPGPSPSAPPVKTVPAPLPTPEVWPLTGLPGVVDRPAVSVKVENSARSRPQTGLEDADLVWEEMVEGGITRFNAVFHSRLPDVVGPIRSLRPMDVGISAPLGGVLAISGGQPGFVADARRAGLQLVVDDEGDDGFFRSRERSAPHNLYGSPEEFLVAADAEHAGAPPPQFRIARSAEGASAATGTPASVIAVSFPAASPAWRWGVTEGRWLRTEGASRAVSADGVQLGADNVVVLRVEVRDTGARDSSGAPVPETVMVGSGDALVAAVGRTLPAQWSKTGPDEPVVLRGADGEELLLAPGVTWVELVPVRGGSVTVTP